MSPQNREITGRDTKGRFVAGVSGNPGGRPVLPEELKRLCQAKGEEAINTALEIMDDPDQPAVARLKAAEILLDRGYGRATQHIEAEVKTEPVVCVEIVKAAADVGTI
jgi:hypothetical protein